LLNSNKENIRSGHRGSFDIIADILENSHENTRKTYFMYRCNLSFRQLKYYLGFLINTGLLSVVDEHSNPAPVFRITEKGKKFLKTYKNLISLIK
jgi:predicted transcriptional regulator